MMQQPCQKTILLEALIAAKPNGISTVYAFNKLGILSLSSRIHELRTRGHVIEKRLTSVTDSQGHEFKRVACYILLSGGDE